MRIGILGGTFDPPHRAHSWIGKAVQRRLDLDQVWLMVANQPPHKLKQPRTNAFHRYAMTVLETMDQPALLASSWELCETDVSYTIDTLSRLRRERPGDQFCFVAGGDSLQELPEWKCWAELMDENTLVFVHRAGVDRSSLPTAVERRRLRLDESVPAPSELPPGILLLELTPPEVSSSDLRGDLAEGRRPPAELLSPAVYRYIRKHRLYGHDSHAGQEGLLDC